MTTQKVQSKIKTSTIAITVLSILLAVAVASTIVLAAFTAGRTATTTITFGGGLNMTLTSAESTDFNEVAATTNATVTITAKDNAFAKDNVEMGALKAQTNQAAYVGFKLSVANGSGTTGTWSYAGGVFTNTEAKLKVTFTTTATAGTDDGVYYFASATTADTDVTVFSKAVISSTSGSVDDIAGKSIDITITFKAESVAGSGSIDNVKSFT